MKPITFYADWMSTGPSKSLDVCLDRDTQEEGSSAGKCSILMGSLSTY